LIFKSSIFIFFFLVLKMTFKELLDACIAKDATILVKCECSL